MMRFWLPLVLLVALLAVPQRAWAHPKIVAVEPADGAQLAAAPPRARVAFNEPIEATFSRIEVFDAQRRAAAPAGGRSPSEPTALEIPLPPLGPGVYTVVWQTVGSDGHQVKGNFAFSISAAAATAPPASATEGAAAPTALPPRAPPPAAAAAQADAAADGPTLALAAALRALMLLGAIGAVGGLLAFALALAPALPPGSPAAALAAQRTRGLALACLLLLLAATLLMLVYHSSLLAGTLTPGALLGVLDTTRYGQALLARLLLGTGMLVLLLPRQAATGWRSAAALGLGGALLLSFALAGHAGAQPLPLLPVLGDWLHLAASALWAGGLMLFSVALPAAARALAPEQRAAALAGAVARFSPLALLSVVTLSVSGAYATLLQLSAPADRWTSAYGQALLVKLLLFAGLVALGAYNLLLVSPRLQTLAARPPDPEPMARWQRRLAWSLRGEVLLAMLIFLAAGTLTSLAPPDSQPPAYAVAPPSTQFVPAPAAASPAPPTPTRTPVPSQPFAAQRPASDLRVRLEVSPASIFKNSFAVQVTDQQGRPRDVQLVRMTLTMIEMDMGTKQIEMMPAGGGRYTASASPLSMVGDWKIIVLVRRVDAPDATATFTVPVGE